MKQHQKIEKPNGETVMVKRNLSKELNLNYLECTNKTTCAGSFDLSALPCNTTILPDYIALYTQPGLYHKTPLTAVGFWLYDDTFDDWDGLYNAIYYHLDDRLEFYKERFAGVKIFFTPDLSQLGDTDAIEQLVRLKKARVIGIWLMKEMGAVVIPFITAAMPKMMDVVLSGLEGCSVVAFSTKGYVNDSTERAILKELVKITVDRLNLHAIVVYDTCKDNKAIEDIFSYAIDRGIKVVAPMNTLKERNIHKANKAAQEKAQKMSRSVQEVQQDALF